MLQRKIAYLNGIPIGHAATWTEVHELLKERHVHILGKPGVAEGPAGFYVQAPFVGQRDQQIRATTNCKAG